MFVVFEGIDGGGKTTLSNRVARGLRDRGLVVEHVRENGQFASSVTQAMRELGRDARNLALTPAAELMLYLTREVQLLDEATRPALGRANVVIADRYVYSAQTLAVDGRGMASSVVSPLVALAMNGVEPDLVILIDVDPDLARARRRVSKLITPVDQAPSRKGLAGTDLQRRLRNGYLALAARDPQRWHVVDNTEADLETIAVALIDMIQLAQHTDVTTARSRTPTVELPTVNPAAPVRATATALTVADRGGPRAALLAWIDRRAVGEPALAAHFLAGLAGPDLDDRRRVLAKRAPAVVAAGLGSLDDEASWELRRELVAVVPGPIARSISGPAAANPAAEALLRSLVEVVPRDVGSALWGRDDAFAWELRDQLPGDAVMESLGGVAGARGWTARDRWVAERGGHAAIDSVSTAELACGSVELITDDRAWELRKAMRPLAPVAALASIFGLTDARSWRWRERGIERAPKVVMQTIAGLDDPRAWALRGQVAPHCEEVTGTITGLDVPRAWQLRDDRVAIWPSGVLKSLGPLAATERGQALIALALARAPSSVAVWRQTLLVEDRRRDAWRGTRWPW